MLLLPMPIEVIMVSLNRPISGFSLVFAMSVVVLYIKREKSNGCFSFRKKNQTKPKEN